MLCEYPFLTSQLDEPVVVAEENNSLSTILVVLRVGVHDGFVARLTLDRIRIPMIAETAVLVEPEEPFTIRPSRLIVQPSELGSERILEGSRLVVVVMPVEFLVDTRREGKAIDWTPSFVVTVSLRSSRSTSGIRQARRFVSMPSATG